jgi:hypothetical protein
MNKGRASDDDLFFRSSSTVLSYPQRIKSLTIRPKAYRRGSERLPLQNKGIFKSLPTFDDNVKGLTAIVTGANGISGFHTMRVLLESPQRWKSPQRTKKVWAASRRPSPEAMMKLLPQEQRDLVEHVALDSLFKPEEIAEALKAKSVAVDVVFCYSYAQPSPKPGAGAWSDAQELVF